MLADYFQGDLGARVTRTDHQDAAFPELRGVSVFARMKLANLGIEFAGELGNPGALVGAGGHDYLRRLEAPVAGEHHLTIPTISNRHYPVDLDPGLDRQIYLGGISIEIISHLIFARECSRRSREGHARQIIAAAAGE